MRQETIATPIAWEDVGPILLREFADLYGVELGEGLPYLQAMVALENGRGKGVMNYNWGNVTTSNPDDPYWLAPGNERLFKAFADHTEGARAFLHRLGSDTHARILRAAMKDDFQGFFDGITTPHPQTKMAYCPDCRRDSVRKNYKSLVDEFKGIVATVKKP